ncbi:hypothetical protein EYF80_050359 [Liparis tanakae]|uniref:Uncharacterized protein n=1 Tax=Liparis tanakae TaxID=230148 RepID=A0A4Z2FGE5_9TELE|nr:hypothetical protein EYF80_050359 [Liparis tanakae]
MKTSEPRAAPWSRAQTPENPRPSASIWHRRPAKKKKNPRLQVLGAASGRRAVAHVLHIV